jgi:hypothetical protein
MVGEWRAAASTSHRRSLCRALLSPRLPLSSSSPAIASVTGVVVVVVVVVDGHRGNGGRRWSSNDGPPGWRSTGRRRPVDLRCRALSSSSGIVPDPPDVAVVPGRLIRDRARPPRRELKEEDVARGYDDGGRSGPADDADDGARWRERTTTTTTTTTSPSSRRDQRRAAIDRRRLLLESAGAAPSSPSSSSPDSSANDATTVGGGGSAEGVGAIALRRGVAGGDADDDPDAPTTTGAAAWENPDDDDGEDRRRGRPRREGRGVPVPVHSVGGDRPPSATDAHRLRLKQLREQQRREGGKEEGSDHRHDARREDSSYSAMRPGEESNNHHRDEGRHSSSPPRRRGGDAGGSVVASRSATARYRSDRLLQQRRRDGSKAEIASPDDGVRHGLKTNPSVVAIPLSDPGASSSSPSTDWPDGGRPERAADGGGRDSDFEERYRKLRGKAAVEGKEGDDDNKTGWLAWLWGKRD